MTDASGKDAIILDRVPHIFYWDPFQKKGKKLTRVTIDLCSEVNIMILVYPKQFGL